MRTRSVVRVRLWLSVVVLGASVLASTGALAQVSTALAQGRVSDHTGGILPGATVTARNESTGVTRTVATDGTGWYRVPALQPGPYEITVTMSGFSTVKRTGIVLTIGQEATIHFEVQLVSLEETVTVTAQAPLIEVSKTTLGTTIDAAKLDNLPLAGRDYLSLVKLAAGVTPQGGSGGMASFGRNSGRTSYVVDGVSQDRNLLPAARGNLSPDAVQEFQVLTNMFSAEYGQASGPVVNILTRSGTNQTHGRMSAFMRANQLDARDYFARGEAPFSQQYYSGNLGGRIIRDRMHYFGSAEVLKQDETVVVTSRLMPGEYPRPLRQIKALGKVDAQLGAPNRLTVRYTIDRSTDENSGVSGLNTIERANSSVRKAQDYQGTLLTLLGGSSVNEFRVLWGQNLFDFESQFCSDCPAIARPGGNLGKATNQPQYTDERRLQFVDHLSMTFGEHALKVGGTFNYVWTDLFMSGGTEGSFRFETDEPFNPAVASTYPVQYDVTIGDGFIGIPDKNVAVFVQDNWRLRPNVTLNLGLRYDWQGQRGVSQDKNNFAPRFGFSWDPSNNGTFLVRGGGGIFYDQNRLELLYSVLLAERGRQQIRIINPGYPDPFGVNPNGTREGARPLPTLTVIDEDKVITYSERASLGFVKALTPSTRLSVDGVYVHGLNVLRTRDINYPDPVTRLRPNPNFGVITQQEASAQTVYYGLETELEQHLTSRLQITLAYTLSKTRHDLDDPVSQLDFSEAMARAGNPHVFNASGLYRLPWDIQLGALVRARSGNYYSVLTGRDDNGDTFITDRPAGEGRNAHTGPVFWVADARVSKSVALGQDRKLEVMIEAFNVTNRPGFNIPENRLTSASFGQFVATSTDYNPRRVQLGARFTF